MHCRYLWLFGMLLSSVAFAAGKATQEAPRDLYLGEAFYYAQQDEYFDAITRLDTELYQYRRLDDPDLDPFHLQANFAEFSIGDFELSYRMHQRAGRAIKAVLEGNVKPELRNEAAYRLARIYYEKLDAANALATIETIVGKVPERIRDDERYLRAQIYMVNNRYADAVTILRGLTGSKGLEGFAGYNLGIALIQNGKEEAGIEQLDKTGQLQFNDEASLAIRDKANLVLGYRLLQTNHPERAKVYLDRVRLEGPFSDKALLGSGWADMVQNRFDRVLVPWTLLSQRNPTDEAVQESLLGVPYAYAKLNLHGKAAVLYGKALDTIGLELRRLDSSIDSIRSGNFLKVLVQEELKQDKNWVVKLRSLPETPETYYLMQMMASNDFQAMLRNYLDLEQLRKRLISWDEYLNAYEEIIAIRRSYYEPLLPDIDKRFRELDSQIRLRLEQKQRLDDRLKHMLVAPRPDFLATADERIEMQAIAALEERYKNDSSETGVDAKRRVARLKGLIHWNIYTSYDQRLTEAYQHLHQLDESVVRLKKIYESFVRTRQAATLSYQGYEKQLRSARTRSLEARERVAQLMARQGKMIEQMAIAELEARQRRLEQYQVQARFSMAESYDRAVKAQQEKTVESATRAGANSSKATEPAAKAAEPAPVAAENTPKAADTAPAAAESAPNGGESAPK